jgi:hypothetical protein
MMTFSYFTYRVKIGNGTTGIQPVAAKNKMRVYPSPSSSFITVKNAGKGIMTIRSIEGKLVLRTAIDQNQTVDISKFESGLYTVTIESGDLVEVQKIVKN